jgi:hypothetical protein
MMLVLLLTLTAPTFAASANPVLSVTGTTVAPVASVTATTTSAALMPGDTGTVVVTITNTLKSPGSGNSTSVQETFTNQYHLNNSISPDYTTQRVVTTSSSDGSSGACEIKFVNLLSEGPVQVINSAYTDIGYLGLGDSAQFQFTIKVDSNAADGKYYLPLKVKTDNDDCYVNQVVAVVVDNTQPRMVLNDAPSKLSTTKSNLIIDVVNYRTNGISSVSVIPMGDEFSFKPRSEYTVGNVGANEMYTVTFETASKNATYGGSPSFVLKYKNGDNWHETAALVVNMEPKTDAAAANAGSTDNSALLILGGIILVVLLLIGGVYLFMRSQRAKK